MKPQCFSFTFIWMLFLIKIKSHATCLLSTFVRNNFCRTHVKFGSGNEPNVLFTHRLLVKDSVSTEQTTPSTTKLCPTNLRWHDRSSGTYPSLSRPAFPRWRSEPFSVTRIENPNPGLWGSCSRLRSRHTHGAGKPSARRLFTFSRSSGADRMPRKSNAGRPTIGLSLFICAKFQFSIQFFTESVLPIATQTDRRNNQNKYQFKILSREHWGLMIKILWLMNR